MHVLRVVGLPTHLSRLRYLLNLFVVYLLHMRKRGIFQYTPCLGSMRLRQSREQQHSHTSSLFPSVMSVTVKQSEPFGSRGPIPAFAPLPSGMAPAPSISVEVQIWFRCAIPHIRQHLFSRRHWSLCEPSTPTPGRPTKHFWQQGWFSASEHCLFGGGT